MFVSPAALFAVAALLAFGFVFKSKLRPKHDPSEPPLVSGSLPIIGHVIGLMRYGFNYYVQVSRRSHAPIFTIQLPGQKLYVVTSPELIQAVQRQPKDLSSALIGAKFSTRICGSSLEAQNILAQNTNGEEGDWGLSEEVHTSMRADLKPSVELDKMNKIMVDEIARELATYGPAVGESQTVNLAEWTRKIITDATTRSVYGPENPYEAKKVIDAFWKFESGLMQVLVGFAPTLTARNVIAARETVADAFMDYYRKRGHLKASSLTSNRFLVAQKAGVPLRDIAKYEVGGSLAVLLNTFPASFWMLFLTFAHRDLLEAIRAEIDAVTTIPVSPGQRNSVRMLDVTNLKENCPLLISTYQEVLRHRSMGISVREVMKDTHLAGRWLLKKGAMVQMPSRVVHQDSHLWGSDVEDFNPRRFMKGEKQKTESGKRPSDVCFRAFGGGKTLCPGRHFATNEVLALVCIFIARYDMEPVEGVWHLPTSDNTNAASVIMTPDHDVPVTIRRRQGLEDSTWQITLNPAGKLFAVVNEDKVSAE